MSNREFDGWTLRYIGWEPEREPLREALLTLGNGHFATRGALEEVTAGGPHYPGTYLAGGFNRRESEAAGRIIENEDLVNWPNWLVLNFRIEQSEWFAMDRAHLLSHERSLDLHKGILCRVIRFRDADDRETELSIRRIVHMGRPNVAAIEWSLTPLNWSGNVEVVSGLDGRVYNDGVARYRQLDGHHLDVTASGETGEDAIYLVAQTRQSNVVVAQAARTRAHHGPQPAATSRTTRTSQNYIEHVLSLQCEQKKSLVVEKVVTLHTSKDFSASEPCLDACTAIHRLPSFDVLLAEHKKAWARLWDRADLCMETNDGYHDTHATLRLHVFHMLQTASINTIDHDVGIPARGLHGEAYRGHIFWDELFTLPFLTFRIPELTRSFLKYRYRRLDEARHAAREAGYKGAMFPWQSGSTGREESQILHLNPQSGRWIEDNTHQQRHVNAAIAFNVWQYFQATYDHEFLSFYGAEMLLDIASFWASIATFNAGRERYEIRGIVGPDEFHTKYPDAPGLGLNNNAYTNVMASWSLHTALTALNALPDDRQTELLSALEISDDDLRHWDEISRRLFVPFHGEGIISQFEGWDDLEELDWEALKERHGDIQRVDRILEAEGRDPNHYKASKQADVLMLFYLFSAEQLQEIFGRLGYEFDPQRIPENIAYYLQRTSHGSTLSRVVHAWVLARTDRRQSWEQFQDALRSDIDDTQGGTTSEGIHLGAMAGTVDLIQRCYSGLEMRGDGVLRFNPQLPNEISCLDLSLRYRGKWLGVHITAEELNIAFEKGGLGEVRIGFGDQVHAIKEGDVLALSLS